MALGTNLCKTKPKEDTMENTTTSPLVSQADALYAEGRIDEALEAYRAVIAEDPNMAWAHSRIGGILAQHGDLTGSEEMLKKALELDPELPQALSNLGNLYYTRGDFEQAMVQYRAAIAVDPANPLYHENLHAAYKKLKRYSDAVAALKQAHRLKREMEKEAGKQEVGKQTQTLKRKLGCLSTLVVIFVATLLIIATTI
jgi:tetratricopeptide (TPR) repeat protein